MSEPIYLYKQGSVRAVPEIPTCFIHRSYARYYDEQGRVESVERMINRNGRSRLELFLPSPGQFYFKPIDNAHSLIFFFHEREDEVLADLIRGEQVQATLRKHGNNRTIVIRDRLKR